MPEGEREVNQFQVSQPNTTHVAENFSKGDRVLGDGLNDVVGDIHEPKGDSRVDGSQKPQKQTKNVFSSCSSDSPRTTSSQLPGHGLEDAARRVGQSHPGVRRDTSQVMDGGRAPNSSCTTTRRTWCGSRQASPDRLAEMGHQAHCGQQEEGHSPGVLPGPEDSPDHERDHCPTAKGCHDTHLRDQSPGSNRSGGIRQGLVSFVRGGEDGRELLCLGSENLGGGWHVPPTSPTGQMAAVGTERHNTRTNRCQDEQQGAQLEPPDPERDRYEGDGCPEHEQPRQQSSSHGCHGSDHGHDEGTEGGDCRPSRTTATQESGEFRRELQRGEWPEHIAERQSECQSAAVSSSLEGRSSLSEKHAKQIELQSMAALPKTFQSLVTGDRKTVLLEVACSPESVLSRVTQETVGYEEAAIRCSHWNNHDLSTGEGVKLVLSQIDRLRPAHVWISTECGPYSPMQNLNQKDEHQRQQLEEKRKAVLKQYVGASCILHYAIQRGCHVTWEWSEKCQAWRLPLIQKIMSRYQMWVSVVHGCQVNLRDPKTKHHLHKGWKLMTTHKRLSRMMDLPCKCYKDTKHAKCEGRLTGLSAYYTPEFAKRVVSAILQEMTHSMVVDELGGESQLPQGFGSGAACMCDHLKQHGSTQQCGSCCQVDSNFWDDNAMMNENPKEGMFKGDPKQVEMIKKQLYKLHAASGHGNTRHMVEALQKRGAPKHVLQLARDFECAICKEKHKVNHKHVASLEPLPPKWSSLEADGGKWIHPVTGEYVEFAMIIDQGSRFRAARIMCRGKHKTMKASMFLHYLQEGWCQYFGHPQHLRLDPAGAFKSNEVEDYCNKHGIFLDFIPGEAHWKLGVCEQAIQGTKELLTKLTGGGPCYGGENLQYKGVGSWVFTHTTCAGPCS